VGEVMENEVMKARLKRTFIGYARRYRSCLRTGSFGALTPEIMTKMIFEHIPLNEVERIIEDIEIIRDRGGEAGDYFNMVLKGFQHSKDKIFDKKEYSY
jgi:hypothetical protein